MSIFSLAAFPAATHVAREAVAGGAQVGHGFLKLLTQLTDGGGGAGASAEATTNSRDAATGTGTSSAPKETLTQRTAAFSQRLASWLRQQSWLKNGSGTDGKHSVELSLDQLDQPHATLDGEPSMELDEALASNPGWLDEFRKLALDRIEQMGPTNSNSPPQSLTIHQDSATIDAQHRWN